MKKHHWLNSLFIFLFALVFEANVLAQEITANLEISNIPLKEGNLWIAWYDNESDYDKGSKGKMAYYQKVIIRTQSETKITLNAIRIGEYAIKLFFDENGNGVIDKNAFGIPKEAYGFSNNVYPAMRAATYEEAKFLLSKNEQIIRIKMKQ